MYSLDKLKEFGFQEKDGRFVYAINPFLNDFSLTIVLEDDKLVDYLYDLDTGDRFILHRVNTTHGAYIASIKEAIDDLMDRIDASCKIEETLCQETVSFIKEYVLQTYGDEFENPFQKYKDVEIVRRKDNEKWYILMFLSLEKAKLGLEDEGRCAAINIMVDRDELDSIVDYSFYFPAYHMSKKSWVTIPLDTNIDFKELTKRIDRSYQLAASKK